MQQNLKIPKNILKFEKQYDLIETILSLDKKSNNKLLETFQKLGRESFMLKICFLGSLLFLSTCQIEKEHSSLILFREEDVNTKNLEEKLSQAISVIWHQKELAELILQRILENFPENIEAQFLLRIVFQENKDEKLQEIFLKELKKIIETGNITKAKQYIQLLLKKNPADSEALSLLRDIRYQEEPETIHKEIIDIGAIKARESLVYAHYDYRSMEMKKVQENLKIGAQLITQQKYEPKLVKELEMFLEILKWDYNPEEYKKEKTQAIYTLKIMSQIKTQQD